MARIRLAVPAGGLTVMLVIGTVRLPPANLPAARGVMAQMVAASRAEDGCVDYSHAEDVLDPGLIRASECWRGQSALDRHLRSDHLRAWRSSWAALGVTDRLLTVHSVAAVRAT